ncbi:ribonuclease P protein component [Mycobacterium sp. M1]|uniref:Ribonuclease P protein component n=1 Tax=Mycolicibacter acidiphilus TaxID=2835306 RepID=A0ABS5RHJ7_9MYCO|nr:ribonuclease P protein component [Mycolicibacter acidiphilus]MBS9533763.1 ribonuclease P protein component [Mycolicibacter acidiphilus]
MLPAEYRMRHSAEFGPTVRYGRRAVQADIVVHARPGGDDDPTATPKVGLIIAKSVGGAVDRHRVARRLRHVARGLLSELRPGEHVVIRALPSSNLASSEQLSRQLRDGLHAAHRPSGSRR